MSGERWQLLIKRIGGFIDAARIEVKDYLEYKGEQ